MMLCNRMSRHARQGNSWETRSRMLGHASPVQDTPDPDQQQIPAHEVVMGLRNGSWV